VDAQGGASRTAVLVCQGRAVAQGRLAANRFSDPTAAPLLRRDELEVVDLVRAGEAPKQWRERVDFAMVQACGEVMAARTVAIDDAVRARLGPQLVILGAGLDGRAWRMSELVEVMVFEVDHRSSQADKIDRLAGLPPLAASVRFVPVDFTRDDLDVELEAAGHQPTVATTWIWEGVVPYLSRDEVEATMKLIAQRSAAGSRLIVNYQAPGLRAIFGRLTIQLLTTLGRRPSPLAGEPRRSAWTPTSMRRLLGRHGFTVISDDNLLTLAERLPIAVRQRRSLENGHVAVADIVPDQGSDPL
jgi:methyltransferase (TIGR00027 family)